MRLHAIEQKHKESCHVQLLDSPNKNLFIFGSYDANKTLIIIKQTSKLNNHQEKRTQK